MKIMFNEGSIAYEAKRYDFFFLQYCTGKINPG